MYSRYREYMYTCNCDCSLYTCKCKILLFFSFPATVQVPSTKVKNRSFFNDNENVLKKLGRINSFYSKDLNKPSAAIMISGELLKIYFDENVDLKTIKDNLAKKQNKHKEEIDKISQRLANKAFVDMAPKNIVDQVKINYNNLKNDIEKISLTIKSL